MTKTLTAGGLLAVLFVGDPAYADVPTAADMIACNEEAREAVRGRTTSPTAKDEARAEDARKGGRNTTERTDATGTITQSPVHRSRAWTPGEPRTPPIERAIASACARRAFRLQRLLTPRRV